MNTKWDTEDCVYTVESLMHLPVRTLTKLAGYEVGVTRKQGDVEAYLSLINYPWTPQAQRNAYTALFAKQRMPKFTTLEQTKPIIWLPMDLELPPLSFSYEETVSHTPSKTALIPFNFLNACPDGYLIERRASFPEMDHLITVMYGRTYSVNIQSSCLREIVTVVDEAPPMFMCDTPELTDVEKMVSFMVHTVRLLMSGQEVNPGPWEVQSWHPLLCVVAEGYQVVTWIPPSEWLVYYGDDVMMKLKPYRICLKAEEWFITGTTSSGELKRFRHRSGFNFTLLCGWDSGSSSYLDTEGKYSKYLWMEQRKITPLLLNWIRSGGESNPGPGPMQDIRIAGPALHSNVRFLRSLEQLVVFFRFSREQGTQAREVKGGKKTQAELPHRVMIVSIPYYSASLKKDIDDGSEPSTFNIPCKDGQFCGITWVKGQTFKINGRMEEAIHQGEVIGIKLDGANVYFKATSTAYVFEACTSFARIIQVGAYHSMTVVKNVVPRKQVSSLEGESLKPGMKEGIEENPGPSWPLRLIGDGRDLTIIVYNTDRLRDIKVRIGTMFHIRPQDVVVHTRNPFDRWGYYTADYDFMYDRMGRPIRKLRFYRREIWGDQGNK